MKSNNLFSITELKINKNSLPVWLINRHEQRYVRHNVIAFKTPNLNKLILFKQKWLKHWSSRE